jgi:hypothetical protein
MIFGLHDQQLKLAKAVLAKIPPGHFDGAAAATGYPLEIASQQQTLVKLDGAATR